MARQPGHEFERFSLRALGFLRLRCGECGHDKLLAFSCKRHGFCPSYGARRTLAGRQSCPAALDETKRPSNADLRISLDSLRSPL